ncbi:MAG TPA: mercury resistance system periplasmic binding protein MerP [Burkholderiaceae bacterium]|nr:mercury resistance system periplasmic binding protein MerP [Burkholderiaceae bacterium]
MKAPLLVCALLATLSASAFAAAKTVTLSIPTMDCPVCPITVKKALHKVPGVGAAEVNLDKRQATVTFDDTKTNIDALTRATRDAGYPSSAMSEKK